MQLSDSLANNEYIRQRLSPRPGDPDYLCLIDLKDAIAAMARLDAHRVLDFGSGGSPYRALFSGGTYHRADLSGDPTLDFVYGPDSQLPADLGGYDFVLSSQVLEHVADPLAYLKECHRVLKPGGTVLVTTHGTFWDHACPYDYWRWTAFGLSRLIESAGFEVDDVRKTTTGPRATLFLMEQALQTRFEGAGWYGALFTRLFALIERLGGKRRHDMADKTLADCRVVDANKEGLSPKHALYICVAVVARKPSV